MTRRLAVVACAVAFAMLLGMTGAEAIIITFTENGWTYTGTAWQNPSGADSPIASNTFEPQGILVTDVYQYGDGRDPWDGVGISPAPDFEPEVVGVIDFIVPTNAVTIDWWIIGPRTMYVSAYDSSANLLNSFTRVGDPFGITSGTDALTGLGISSIEFHDTGGFVLFSTLEFEPIPEPTTMLMLGGLGAGLAGARKLRRKK